MLTNEHLLDVSLSRPEKNSYLFSNFLLREHKETETRTSCILTFEINWYMPNIKIECIALYVYTKILALGADGMFIGSNWNWFLIWEYFSQWIW